ncbi:MAG: DUF2490 domain-containing protein [Acidobacteriota bacterium]
MEPTRETKRLRARQTASGPLAIAVFALCLALSATAPTLADDNQGWTALFVNGPATDGKFLLWFDGHARFRDDAQELGVSIIRPGVGWRLSDKLSLWAGVARVTVYIDGPDIDEDRIWQQATYRLGSPFGGSLSGRTRLEQRFRDDQGDDTGWRIRQFVRWAKPIGDTKFGWLVWDELFWGLNDADWGQRDGFDQNRLLIGFTWQANDRMRIEAGYLNNILDTPGGSDRTNHNVSVGLAVGL